MTEETGSVARRPERPARGRTLLVNAAELTREPGLRKHVQVAVPAAEVDVEHPSIVGDLAVDLVLASTKDDVEVDGTITIPWHSVCRRCLTPLDDLLVIPVDDRFSDRVELVERDEASPIERGQIDLATLVRDEVLLTLAEERLCREDCAGLCPTCGANRNDTPCGCESAVADDRWAALDALREPDD